MDYSILINLLREKQYLTDLEKDILDTWNELQKNPFNMHSAAQQVHLTMTNTKILLLWWRRCRPL